MADAWQRLTDAFADSITRIAVDTSIPEGPLRPPDIDEMRRIVDQARALRPEGDRFVMGARMFEVVKRISKPGMPPHSAGLPFGIPVIVDAEMPDGVIEFRDGDRVVQRIEYKPAST